MLLLVAVKVTGLLRACVYCVECFGAFGIDIQQVEDKTRSTDDLGELVP